MKKCMFCGEINPDLIEKHHTIPRSINPNWTKTEYVCVKCHKILHMYFLEDIITIIKKMKEICMWEYDIFTENGIINYGLNETELHKNVVAFLYRNIPKESSNLKLFIKYKEILKNVVFHEKNNREKGQRLGYIIKDLGIDKKKMRGENVIVYTARSISLLRRYKKSRS